MLTKNFECANGTLLSHSVKNKVNADFSELTVT